MFNYIKKYSFAIMNYTKKFKLNYVVHVELFKIQFTSQNKDSKKLAYVWNIYCLKLIGNINYLFNINLKQRKELKEPI